MDIPIAREPQVHTPWIAKFIECFFAGVICVNSWFVTINLWPRSILEKLGDLFIGFLFLGQFLLGILIAVGYTPYWQKRERKGRIDSGRRHAWLRGILRYWLAFEIATYGFAKLLKTQFAISYSRGDTPVGQLNGFDLTWNYFGHSYALAVIIGLLQIAGSILLLFRRTTLFGIVILLPILVNIVLINVFYKIAIGAFLNSLLFTMGLTYLLLLRAPQLLSIFWAPATGLPTVRLGVLKHLFRVLAIALAFGLLFYAVRRNPVSPLAGKWTVRQLVRGHDTVRANAWLTDSTAWSSVYIEERGQLALCPNPYIFDARKSLMTHYNYDSGRHQLRLILLKNRNDTSVMDVRRSDSKNMRLGGVINGDSVSLELTRAVP